MNIHVSVTSQDIINDLNGQISKLNNENMDLRLKLNYVLGCITRLNKKTRESVGLIEESDFQKQVQKANKGDNSPSERPLIG